METKTATTPDALNVQLRDYLAGYSKRDSNDLCNMKNTMCWKEMAGAVVLKRATSFLDVLPDDILRAIATGQIDFLKEVDIVAGVVAPVQADEEPTEELLAALTEIAVRRLRIDTLRQRGRDRLDFHDVGVMGLRKALVDAFNLGARSH